MLASCSGADKSDRSNADSALNDASRQELIEAINERDQLLALVNEINSATAEIKNMEQIVSINAAGAEMSEDTQLTSDMQAIRDALEQRRKKIEDLERKLKTSNSNNTSLLATIDGLKSQLASQAAQISDLSTRLGAAEEQIAALDQTVALLTDSVQTVTGQRDAAQQEAYEQEQLANACYYVVATRQELKNHNIIEGGGFLKKTKVMDGDFDKSFFITRDKRTLTQIPLHSTKAKVLTSYQPEDSYEIVDINGQKVLRIINPNKFWAVSNYLVIQVD
ncbi:MAG: hypothetical protein K2N16_01905 [Muribaculaceae bacterium]|nr:hypothetical protein [Muribaculaceae bacterium]